METTKLFIYGTLRKEAKYHLKGANFLGLDSVTGKIYHLEGHYPGFKRGRGKVIGEVVEINETALRYLDCYEGEEYKRVQITTAKGIVAWIYEYIPDTFDLPEIKSGDWTQVLE